MSGSSAEETQSNPLLPPRLGKYYIITRLGRGGMAEVFLAATKGPAGFTKLLVLKVLADELESDERFVKQFMDEARLAARLSHPNIASVLEVGTYDGKHAIVMEYLEGRSLAQLRNAVQPRHALSVELELAIVAEALRGLHYAHELTGFEGEPLEIVHRDLSANNVFVTYDGEVKVLDFGIAKSADRSHQTETYRLKGTLRYIPPEAMHGERVDRRADVYAAGVLMWEAATQQTLWREVPEVQVLSRVANSEIPRARDAVDTVPEELDAIIADAMRGSPQDRIPTVESLSTRIRDYLSEAGAPNLRNELSTVMATTFSEHRSKRRAIVHKALANVSGPRPTAPDDGMEGVTSETLLERPGQSGSALAASEPGARTGGRFPSATVLLVVFGGSLVVTVLVLLFTGTLSPEPAAVPLAPAPGQVEETEPPASPGHVVLELEVDPPDALISVDGEPLSGAPRIRVPRDPSARYVFRVEKTGFEPEVVVLAADSSESVSVGLVPLAAIPEVAGEKARAPASMRRRPRSPPTPVTPPAMETPMMSPPQEIDRGNPWAD